jgi:hypothetical protein
MLCRGWGRADGAQLTRADGAQLTRADGAQLTRAGGARLMAVLVAAVMAVFWMPTLEARADTPEYWNKETFRTSRPIVVAALSDIDDEAAPRRATRKKAKAPRSLVYDRSPAPRKSRRTAARRGVQVASLGPTYVPQARPQRSIAGGGGVRWVASASCLNGSLRSVIAQVASQFGSVTVNSTCRSRSRNARVGGARRSMHLTGDAADFRVHGNWRAASSFIRSLVGGFKHYGGGLFHIDTGARRSW